MYVINIYLFLSFWITSLCMTDRSIYITTNDSVQEHIMWNAGLDEAQTGIKIARGNINNLWYADDTTLTGECEEELKSLLMKVKEESEKVGLKLNL